MTYDELKIYLNNLNLDKSHFTNSNDICTPMECVEEMVNAIPSEFWNRENLSILDPCCGNGNFPAYILQKSKNIILTANEINPVRMANLKNVLVEYDNIIYSSKDFLKDTFETQYDLIIANPPFALFTEGGKRAAKNHSVSKEFILKSLEMLRDDGYLVYIIPDNWMSLSDSNETVRRLSKYQFIKIDIHGAKKYFKNVGSSFTWFVLKKTSAKEPTIISNNYRIKQEDTVLISSVIDHIPLFYNEIVQSILNKTLYSDKTKFNIETTSFLHKYTQSSYLSTKRDNLFQYEVIHTPKQTVWSSKEHKFQKGWKVFISLTSYYEIFSKKDTGMTQSIAFIKVDTEQIAIKTCLILSHPLYRFLNEIHRYGNFNNIRILQKLPVPDKEDIWESFNINQAEKELIFRILKI